MNNVEVLAGLMRGNFPRLTTDETKMHIIISEEQRETIVRALDVMAAVAKATANGEP